MGFTDIQAQIQAAIARAQAEERARAAAAAAADQAKAAAQAQQQAQQPAAQQQALQQAVQSKPEVQAHLGKSWYETATAQSGQPVSDPLAGLQQGLHDAAKSISEIPADLQKAGQQIADGARAVADGLVRLGGGDSDKEIDLLQKPGDKYVYGQDVSVSATGGVYEKDAVAVERQKGPDGNDRYVVSADAGLGGGLYGDTGVDAGIASLKLSANTTGGGAGRVEYSFDNPEDAKRATKALINLDQTVKQAASTAPMMAMPGAGPVVAAADYLRIKNAVADCAKFDKNISAVEYRGETAAQAQATAGIGNDQLGAKVFAGARFDADKACRVEYKDGKPTAVVMREDFSGDLKAGAQAGTAESQQKVQAGLKGTMTLETRFELPPGTPPDADLSKLLPTCKKTEKVTLTTDESFPTNGKQRKIEFVGDAAKLFDDPAVRDAFMRGDTHKVMEAARAYDDVTVTTRTYTMDALEAPFSAKLEGIGVSTNTRSERRNYSDPLIVVEPRLES